MTSVLTRLGLSPDLIAKLLRFALVGLVNGGIYTLVTLAFIHGAGFEPLVSSLIGYLAVLPSSFFGHKRVTFQSGNDPRREFRRFLISYALGLMVSLLVMHGTVRWLALPSWVGVAAAILLVPPITFIVLDSWVFLQKKRPVAQCKDQKNGT